MTGTVLASSSDSVGIGVVIIIVIGLYFVPSIIAQLRHVPNVGSVVVINVFLGWTLLGWIIAMAMAMRSGAQATIVNVHGPGGYYPPQQGYAPAFSAPPDLTRPAGWYSDPHGAASQRYWDGDVWTSHTS